MRASRREAEDEDALVSRYRSGTFGTLAEQERLNEIFFDLQLRHDFEKDIYDVLRLIQTGAVRDLGKQKGKSRSKKSAGGK